MGILGFSIAFVFVPQLGEIIAAIQEKEKIEESPFLNDKASGMFNAAYGFGNFLAPMIGAAIYKSKDKNFRGTCDIMAISSFVLFFLHFFFASLPLLIKNARNSKKNLVEAKNSEVDV